MFIISLYVLTTILIQEEKFFPITNFVFKLSNSLCCCLFNMPDKPFAHFYSLQNHILDCLNYRLAICNISICLSAGKQSTFHITQIIFWTEYSIRHFWLWEKKKWRLYFLPWSIVQFLLSNNFLIFLALQILKFLSGVFTWTI